MPVKPFRILGKRLPERLPTDIPGIGYLNFTRVGIHNTVIKEKRYFPARLPHPVKTAPTVLGADIEIEFLRHKKNSIFGKLFNNHNMSLIPNNKKKKDSKALAGPKSNTPGFPGGKGKANTKAVNKNTRQTGGSQRGS